MSSRRHQRGVALLVAILLVALGTIIAAAMAYNNAMTARRAAGTFAFDQALLVAEGGEALAAYGLALQAKMNATYIGPDQAWNRPFPPTEVAPGVTLEAYMQDMQGRFNINNLVNKDGETPNPTAVAVFQRLLQRLDMDPKWADLVVDWIDQDSTPLSDGGEDSVYMEMDPPYRTANMPVTSISELMALPGFTRADFDKLAPHIVALPIGTKVNVCSADGYVLDALTGVEQFSAMSPDEFAKDRQAASGCFPPLATVKVSTANVTGGTGSLGSSSTGTPNGTQQTVPQDLVGQTSSWFRLSSFINVGSSEFAVYTVLFQDSTGVRPMMRSFTPD
ncbi:MAG TPA: type II secretion system minor pseudopilin GspK [Steroidobacteraceae bacterium]|nr:type II secretion system minor pseudopilin GspK [Steroidobacteraceae bacterium]